MKILLLGSNGQVGWELGRCLLPLGEVVSATRAQADLTDYGKLQEFLKSANPDVIVNAAAYTGVDKAETEQDLADSVNHIAPAILAEQAELNGALLVHFSTDYVFDGTKESPYTEQDEPCPVSVYGRSKLAGEQAIRNSGCDFLIFRTSWVFASRGHNFLRTILRLAGEREELNIVSDQVGAPSWARLIAETTAHCLRQAMTERKMSKFNSDIYHLTARGETSWHGFAEAIVEFMPGHWKNEISLQKINPITTAEFPLPAERPKNSRLDTSLLENHFGLSMPGWEKTLKLCMEEIRN